jgi:hypothetical protein
MPNIHGNLEDFERLSQLFDAALCEDEEGVHWVILGDIVHGPNDVSRQKHPELYGYLDESLKVVRGVARMQRVYPGKVHARRAELLSSLLTHYGQSDDVASQVLDNLSRGGIDLRVIVHGHDRDERGFFTEGQRQLCLCIFGAPRQEKRYLRVNLGGRYGHASDLRDGFEIRRLYD